MQEQTKPIVRIRDAYLGKGIYENRLFGVVEDYPDEHQCFKGAVENGKEVITSKIIKHWELMNRVETERTIYSIVNWK